MTGLYDLKIDLPNPDEDQKKRKENVKKQKAKRSKVVEIKAADWKRIEDMKNSNADKQRLAKVKELWKQGEVTKLETKTGKVTKADLLRLFLEVQQTIRERKIKELVKSTPKNYRLVQTKNELDSLISKLSREEIIAVDTETTGVDVFGDDELVGVSLTLPKADIHVYVPVAHDTGKQLDRNSVIKALGPFLKDPELKKVLHNAKFDIHVFNKYGVKVTGVDFDTMVAMWVLNENEPTYRLKDLATKYLKEPADTFGELFGSNCKFNTIPIEVALVYAAKDTDLTYRLYLFQLAHLKRTGLIKLYREIENPLIDICVEMERTGLLLDKEFAKAYGEDLKDQIDKVKEELIGHFGDINFNSPVQLQKIFYDDLGLPDVSKKRSTDVKTLKALKDEHPGINTLLKYRELVKLYSTYIEALPKQIKADGRLHGSFNQSRTVTGRFASNNPNLQNLPTEARKIFVAPDGQIIVGADFSQIEPRILAHFSQDLKFMRPYLNGEDLYSSLAAEVFNKTVEECGDGSPERKKMKMGLLAVMYGTSMWTLADQLGITVEEADKFITDFYAKYTGVARWIQSVWDFVKENEYVKTMFGRKRRFPGHREKAIIYDQAAKEICDILGTEKVPYDVFDRKDQIPYKLRRRFGKVKGEVERVRRMAVNAIIQGSAADIMKLSLIELHKYTQQKGWLIFGTVHDEALINVSRNATLEEIEGIEKAMLSAVKLDVPMKIDVAIMERWGKEHTKADWFKLAS